MMTRREMLVRMLGAAAAAAVAPLIDLTDTTPAFWNQLPLQKLLPWRIAFPDGTTFHFNATVVAEKLLDDGSVELTMQPQGGMKATQEVTYRINYIDGTSGLTGDRPARMGVRETRPERLNTGEGPVPTVLHASDGSKMELTEIAPIPLDQSITDIDDREFVIPGLRRISTLKFTVKV